MSLKDCIARDIDNVFMRTTDFCDNLVIQVGTMRFPIIGSLQSNVVQNNSGNGQPLQSNSWILYCKYPIIAPKPKADFGNVDTAGDPTILWNILSAGTRITIAGCPEVKGDRPFTVVSVSNELGLATIQLQTKTGR